MSAYPKKKYVHPLQIGSLALSSNILYAPLAGCSDLPFRKMSQKYAPALVFTEMVKVDAIIRHDSNSFRFLDYEKGLSPIGAQICGSNPENAAIAAKMIADLGFDLIDLNCGCPVDKVTKDGSGSAMLKSPLLIGKMIEKMVAAVSIPVTIKIRLGWDLDSINAPEITQIAEEAGAQAISIHGRTRSQKYQGQANWDYIAACKKRAKTIKVIGNGDLFTAQDAIRLLENTGCDGALIARGTLGQPWIAEDIRRVDAGISALPITKNWLLDHLRTHFLYICSYKDEKRALFDARRIACWYLTHLPGIKKLRCAINQAQSIAEVTQLIQACAQEDDSLYTPPVDNNLS